MSDENNREIVDNVGPVNLSNLPNPFNEGAQSENQSKQTSKRNKFYESPQSKLETLNTGIAVKTIESESLNSLLVYDSDSSSSSEMTKLNFDWQSQKSSSDSSSSTDSSSSSSDEEDDDDDDDDDGDGTGDDADYSVTSSTISNLAENRGAVRKEKAVVKTDGELSAEQLPPVPDLSRLSISVDSENFFHMGNVFGIVDKLVTVAAIPNTPAYDLDTLLFLDNGKRPLGFVFDVLGPVTSPIYAVRFNSVEDIQKLQIHSGTKVYSAPTSEHTQYVFVQHLLKMKGSDASWFGDNEVPAEFADYSDDENECYHRHGNKKSTPHLKRTHSGDNYKKFESSMNQKNILNTKFNKYLDSYNSTRLNKSKSKGSHAPHINATIPVFNPSIPPPNMGHYMTFYHQQASGSMLPLPSDYVGMVYGIGSQNTSDASNSELSQNQYFTQNFFMNNFVNNLNQTNSANYVTNQSSNSHPGPSHE